MVEQQKQGAWPAYIQWRYILLTGPIQLALVALAAVGIRQRPASTINGAKALWVAFVFFNGIGPLVYYLLGRRPSGAEPSEQLAA
jgi:hypothetical protein